MIDKKINLDHAASTPLHPLLMSQLTNAFGYEGNAQSEQTVKLHQLIDDAKKRICNCISGNPDRLFFTSGATESINTAIIGSAEFYQRSGQQIITFETEHSSTLAAAEHLKQKGFTVDVMPVLANGCIDYKQLKSKISRDTLLISVNHVCNETGLVQDLETLFELRKQFGFLIHIDACQTIGKLRLSLDQYPADYVSLSAHKCHGPQGIGALYIANNRHIIPRIYGKHPVRPGTPSQALIYLMGHAYEIAQSNIDENNLKVKQLNQIFKEKIQPVNHRVLKNVEQVPHIINVCFPQASIEQMKEIKKRIFCQNSSSCFKGGRSHVLTARQMPLEEIDRSLRFSFTHLVSQQDIRFACSVICDILQK